MNKRPILFSAPMVLALLAGRKTQTRRIIREQFDLVNGERFDPITQEDGRTAIDTGYGQITCRYGKPGDLLWVRETLTRSGALVQYAADKMSTKNLWPVTWMQDPRPSIHMPRSASRLTLRLTDVRVQRVQSCSEADAEAEGVEREGAGWKSYEMIHAGPHKGERHPHATVPNRTAVISYREVWESINGAGSWERNPWVWALTFEVLRQNVDAVPQEKTA